MKSEEMYEVLKIILFPEAPNLQHCEHCGGVIDVTGTIYHNAWCIEVQEVEKGRKGGKMSERKPHDGELYLPDKGVVSFEYDDPNGMEYHEYVKQTDERFHIGQGYAPAPAAVLECTICHGRTFEVASEEYFTAVRCVNCKWEALIHEG